MNGFIKKLKTAAKNHTTYQVGLLQAKAYRILKQETTTALSHLDISTVEWAFLGILYEDHDHTDCIRLAEASDVLGVEAPFVTVMFNKLKKKGLVESRPDPKDSRAKLICVTTQGRKFVAETELYLREKMKPLFKDVSKSDVLAYLSVLDSMVKNSKN